MVEVEVHYHYNVSNMEKTKYTYSAPAPEPDLRTQQITHNDDKYIQKMTAIWCSCNTQVLSVQQPQQERTQVFISKHGAFGTFIPSAHLFVINSAPMWEFKWLGTSPVGHILHILWNKVIISLHTFKQCWNNTSVYQIENSGLVYCSVYGHY